MAQFILASQSPRRKSLLEWAELPFEIVVSDSDENYPATIPIIEVPAFIATNKALAVQEKMEQSAAGTYNMLETCIIAADTVVVLDQQIIGKPILQCPLINQMGTQIWL
jgi:septum formation protein